MSNGLIEFSKIKNENVPSFLNPFTLCVTVRVLLISSQGGKAHELWVKDVFGDLPFAMASDPEGFHGKRFGFWDKKEKVNRRGLVLIDNEGIIQGINAVGYNVIRTSEDILYFAKTIKERTYQK